MFIYWAAFYASLSNTIEPYLDSIILKIATALTTKYGQIFARAARAFDRKRRFPLWRPDER